MRRTLRIVLAIALVVVVLGLIACGGTPDAGSPTGGSTGGETPGTDGSGGGTAAAVGMSGLAFAPASVEIAVGGTVTWTNDDTVPHTVTGADWDSGTLAVGATFSQTFDTAGTFDYACGIHPAMTGTVVVK